MEHEKRNTMILNGKAKEDFLKWVYSEYDYEYNDLKDFYPLHLIDTLIIEWFDSVGINIDAYYCDGVFEIYVGEDYIGEAETRKESTQKAIIKANEIYNEI